MVHQNKAELEKLAVWEGEKYEVDVCEIVVGGVERLLGNVFVAGCTNYEMRGTVTDDSNASFYASPSPAAC